MNKELNALHEQNAIDAGRYRAIKSFMMMDEDRQNEIEELLPFETAKTEEEMNKQTDALVILIGNSYADAIHAPPAFQELDPTTRKGCCGECLGNCQPEEGWGPSDKAD